MPRHCQGIPKNDMILPGSYVVYIHTLHTYIHVHVCMYVVHSTTGTAVVLCNYPYTCIQVGTVED